MTTSLLTPTEKIAALGTARDRAMARAKAARDDANADANRDFASGVRAILASSEMTVAEVATVVGMNRVRVHQILREYEETPS